MDIYSHVLLGLQESEALVLDAKLSKNSLCTFCAHRRKIKALQSVLEGFFMPKIVVTRLGVEPRTY